MIIRFKKLHPEAPTPSYSQKGDAAVDLTATSITYDSNGNLEYGLGIAIEIPQGYVGLIYPRSSICKYGLSLRNSVAVIDSNFRGELKLKFAERGASYNIGDRIGQLIVQPVLEMSFVEVESLTQTNRGEGGFGSSGL